MATPERKASVLELEALQHYDLQIGDRLMIAHLEFEYCEKGEKKEDIRSNEGENESKVEIYCEGSDEMSEIKEESTFVRPEEEIEIPGTQEILSQDMLSDLNECIEEDPKPSAINLLDTERVNMEVKEEEIAVESSNDDDGDQYEVAGSFETQPVFYLPPATRSFTRQQREIKPTTRTADEFEFTQTNHANYSFQTQAFKMKDSKKKAKPLQENKSPPNIFVHRGQPKKVTHKYNSILYSSSEEEDNVEIKMEEMSPAKVSNVFADPQTPEKLPKMPSQSLMNTEFLERVNASQPNNDNTVLDFKQEEEEDDVLSKINSFKRAAGSGSPKQIKKKRFKKIMKYDLSDEEN